MGEPLSTKTKIIKLLSTKRMTLTDLCKQLDLAPSTMNQHLTELVRMHAIKQADIPYAIKWKYYEVDPSFRGFNAPPAENMKVAERIQANKPPQSQSKVFATNTIYRIIGAILVVAVVGFFVLGAYGSQNTPAQTYVSAEQYLAPNSTTAAGSTIFSISDAPASLPLQALNITISSMIVHNTDGKWYVVFNGTKKFDLVQLDNISAVVAGANIPNGMYNFLLLKITNATAVLNNQSQKVFVPNNTILVHSEFNISNGTANWVNVDVNLSSSIHITPSGQLVLLPILTIDKFHGYAFHIDQNFTVRRGEGVMDWQDHFYMNVNGTMSENSPGFGRWSEFQMSTHGLSVMQNVSANTPIVVMWHSGRLGTQQQIRNMTNMTSAAAPGHYWNQTQQTNFTAGQGPAFGIWSRVFGGMFYSSGRK
jgi:DNA-binding transcriptional ArsR family regulator